MKSKRVKEPIATYTNIAYPAAGIAALFAVQPGIILEALIIAMTLLMGVGSALFHATRRRDFQKVDEVSMYALLLSVMAFNIGHWWLAPVALLLSAGAGMIHQKLSSTLWVGLLGVVNLLLIGWQSGEWKYSLFIFIIFFASYILRQFGEQAWRFDQDIAYNLLHGAWHIGTALVIYLMLISGGIL